MRQVRYIGVLYLVRVVHKIQVPGKSQFLEAAETAQNWSQFRGDWICLLLPPLGTETTNKNDLLSHNRCI